MPWTTRQPRYSAVAATMTQKGQLDLWFDTVRQVDVELGAALWARAVGHQEAWLAPLVAGFAECAWKRLRLLSHVVLA